MTRRRLAVLAPPLLALLPCATASPAAAASDEALLRRHAPVLVLDAREPGPPIAVEPFLRGARGPRARAAAPPRVYGHAVREGGRLWLQYWLFYADNPQDRGIARSGRHDRPWPDPNDEARGDGLRVRPPVTLIGDERPRWVASPMRWGASRAAWWSPAEQSSPVGPRFQDDGRWRTPAAFHEGARACAAGPPGHPWWVFAVAGALAATFIGAVVRGLASRA